MKAFIIRLGKFILPLFCLFLLIEFLLRSIPNDYSYKNQFLEEHIGDVECLVLGSSHAYFGINPSYLDGMVFNAAHVSQTIDYDFRIFEKFIDRGKQLNTVLLPLDYFTLFGRVELGLESWRVKNYQIYYRFINSLSPQSNFELLGPTLPKNFKRIKVFLLKSKSDLLCDSLGFGNFEREQADLLETGSTAAKRHTKEDRSYYSESVLLFEKMINEALDRNIEVVIYTTPLYKSYRDNLDITQDSLNKVFLSSIKSAYPNVVYLDYSCDDRFLQTDFRDGDHLNTSGAKKLSLLLRSRIKNK